MCISIYIYFIHIHCIHCSQDIYVNRLIERVDKLQENNNMYSAQIIAQKEETTAAAETLREAKIEIEVIYNLSYYLNCILELKHLNVYSVMNLIIKRKWLNKYNFHIFI